MAGYHARRIRPREQAAGMERIGGPRAWTSRMIEPRGIDDPEQVGTFRVIGRLGAGGFGTVYVAESRERPDELVALKIMQSSLAGDRDFRDRFAKEIRAIERVYSPYVPRLEGYDVGNRALWLATGLVRGPSLDQVVRRSGPLPERTVWSLALGIARGLCDIHDAKLVHRDLKPGNVLLVADGPRIIDFGLAHLTEADHQTALGLPMCSPDYAPPEQRRSLRDARKPGDVFTLGGTLLFAATAHAPYGTGRDPLTAPPNLADLPDSLYDVVAQCLCKAEEARPGLDVLIAEFEHRAATTAGGNGLPIPSVLTAEVTNVIDAWQRELDEVSRTAGAVQTVAGPWDEPGGGPAWLPSPGARLTAPLTDAHAQTDAFPRNQYDGRITVPHPSPGRSRHAGGWGTERRWKVRLGDWVRAPVAVTRETAVAASLDGVVACFAARSGYVLGTANLGVPVRAAVLPPGATPTSWAYAGGADGVLYAIDLASGEYWSLLSANGAIEGPPVAAGDCVYILSADGCVYEVDARLPVSLRWYSSSAVPPWARSPSPTGRLSWRARRAASTQSIQPNGRSAGGGRPGAWFSAPRLPRRAGCISPEPTGGCGRSAWMAASMPRWTSAFRCMQPRSTTAAGCTSEAATARSARLISQVPMPVSPRCSGQAARSTAR